MYGKLLFFTGICPEPDVILPEPCGGDSGLKPCPGTLILYWVFSESYRVILVTGTIIHAMFLH
jgi:hypothetical protein